MKNAIYAILGVCLFLQAGCMKSHHKAEETRLITADTYKAIVGMQWILEKMTVDGRAFQLKDEKPFLLVGDDKKVSGFGCNEDADRN